MSVTPTSNPDDATDAAVEVAPATSFRDHVERYYADRKGKLAGFAVCAPAFVFYDAYKAQVGKPRRLRLQHASKSALGMLALAPLALPAGEAFFVAMSAGMRQLAPAHEIMDIVALIAFMGMLKVNRQSRPIAKAAAAAVGAVFTLGAATTLQQVYKARTSDGPRDSTSSPSNNLDTDSSVFILDSDSGRER